MQIVQLKSFDLDLTTNKMKKEIIQEIKKVN